MTRVHGTRVVVVDGCSDWYSEDCVSRRHDTFDGTRVVVIVAVEIEKQLNLFCFYLQLKIIHRV